MDSSNLLHRPYTEKWVGIVGVVNVVEEGRDGCKDGVIIDVLLRNIMNVSS